VPAARTIDEYLAPLPARTRAALEEVRATIASAAPEATEAINYQMPAFRYRGTWLVGFGAFKNHCSFFPGTIRFTAESPIAPDLVRKTVESRVQEIDARAKRT
jgi:uncharacterized protein YdhG (YjbR/CyaY superfamily)